jgi:hypothetical protein
MEILIEEKDTYIRADDNKRINKRSIAWVKKIEECLSIFYLRYKSMKEVYRTILYKDSLLTEKKYINTYEASLNTFVNTATETAKETFFTSRKIFTDIATKIYDEANKDIETV